VKKKYKGFDQRNKEPGDRKRIQCKDMFDMIAGTSSSSILTAYLTRPNDKNSTESYYAQDAIQYFMEEGPKFF
jgi:patatin-like phospholipase/acyl hydrolase